MFSQVSVILSAGEMRDKRGGVYVAKGDVHGGMHGRGACMAKRGMHWVSCMAGWGIHGRGHAWQQACVTGGLHGRGVWQGACKAGGVHGGACMAGGMHGRGVVHGREHVWQGCAWQEGVWQGGMHGGGGLHGWGMCDGGCAWQGSMHGGGACMAGETATAAYGMHPTGMHSYSYVYFFSPFEYSRYISKLNRAD